MAGLVAILVLLVLARSTHAAEIKVLSGMGMRAILTGVAEEFERATGHKLILTFDTAGLVKDRVLAGEETDVAVMQRYLLDELIAQGKVTRVDAVDIARSQIALFSRAGGLEPDIGSADALKRALLEAQSISSTDPANGGLSGSHFAKVLEQLGITRQVKPKMKLGKPSLIVINGEAEIGVLQLSEILPLAGARLIGRLPEQFQDNTPVSAAVVNGAREADAGRVFVKFLSSPAAAGAIRSFGMQPVE